MTARRPRVELFVDELVLRGIPPERAQEVAEAIELALASRAEEGGGLPTRGRDDPWRASPGLTVPDPSPAALGDAVAGAVWGGVTGDGGPVSR